MIRIAICDDSAVFLSQTQFMLEHWDDKPQVVHTQLFEDGDSLIQAHLDHPFDIILLDVVMPLLNGIDTARELREQDKTVKIVFLTSSAEFAVESYAVKASNYLLKPVVPAKLFACLDELITELEANGRCLNIKGGDSTHHVLLSSIEFAEAQNKQVRFALADGKSILSPEPLYSYENKLVLDDGFFKCHRSYIVNLHAIDSFTQKEITMHSGTRIPISRSCQKNFESIYFSVLFGKAGEEK